jgi:hypothetical protein
VGLYTTAKWAFPPLTAKATTSKPTFLVTGGAIYRYPGPSDFSLSIGKVAQYNLTRSLEVQYEPQGVYIAIIVVAQTVTPIEVVYNPANIALQYWTFYAENKPQWRKEVDI